MQAGTKETTITIQVLSDLRVEPDETFDIILSNFQGVAATLDAARSRAVGTIINDDMPFDSYDIGSWKQISKNGVHNVWAPREGHTSVVYNGRMWVIGGFGNKTYNDVWNSSDGSIWTRIVNNANWGFRRGYSSTVFDNKMWVIGGISSDTRLNDIWFSENGFYWARSNASNHWQARYGHQVTALNNKLWVVGGNIGIGDIAEDDVWSTENGVQWQRTTGHMGSKVFNHSLNALNNKLLLVGGQNTETALNKFLLSSNDGVQWNDKYYNYTRTNHSSAILHNKLWVLGDPKTTKNYQMYGYLTMA